MKVDLLNNCESCQWNFYRFSYIALIFKMDLSKSDFKPNLLYCFKHLGWSQAGPSLRKSWCSWRRFWCHYASHCLPWSGKLQKLWAPFFPLPDSDSNISIFNYFTDWLAWEGKKAFGFLHWCWLSLCRRW